MSCIALPGKQELQISTKSDVATLTVIANNNPVRDKHGDSLISLITLLRKHRSYSDPKSPLFGHLCQPHLSLPSLRLMGDTRRDIRVSVSVNADSAYPRSSITMAGKQSEQVVSTSGQECGTRLGLWGWILTVSRILSISQSEALNPLIRGCRLQY